MSYDIIYGVNKNVCKVNVLYSINKRQRCIN